jgi:beta-barrel assembly-enhancing protease
MPSFFENLGRSCGRMFRKARWLGQELTGTEDQALEAEYRVGRDLAEALAAELPEDQKPVQDDRVDACGQRLVACVTNRKRRFRFWVLPSRAVNACALPGGFIYITEPLVTACQPDEAHLAFVLAHEMGHVVRFHAKDRILGNSLLSLVLTAAPASGVLHQGLRALSRQFLQSAYSQEQEFEADAVGVKLLRFAGFDAAAAVRVLRLLQARAGRESELSSYFSSHPPFPTRIAHAQRLIQH